MRTLLNTPTPPQGNKHSYSLHTPTAPPTHHTQGTVGAGLPIIGTLKHLLETGDKAQTIEGIFSGTLSYIFNTFGDGRPFSEIVAGAKAEVRRGWSRWAMMVGLPVGLVMSAQGVIGCHSAAAGKQQCCC
jgi:hypothetical protein